MAPFLLLVVLFLLLVWRFFGPSWSSTPFACPDGTEVYRVKTGDTCWAIAERVGSSVQELVEMNEGLECEALRAGAGVCVPVGGG